MADRALGNPLGNPLGLARRDGVAQYPHIIDITDGAGTYLTPPGFSALRVTVVGAGGGGSLLGGGGGGGGCSRSEVFMTNGATTAIEYEIGVGGSPGVGTAKAGNGTATTARLRGVTLVGGGGIGGSYTAGPSTTYGGAGGTGAGGVDNFSGGAGGSGASNKCGPGGGGGAGPDGNGGAGGRPTWNADTESMGADGVNTGGGGGGAGVINGTTELGGGGGGGSGAFGGGGAFVNAYSKILGGRSVLTERPIGRPGVDGARSGSIRANGGLGGGGGGSGGGSTRNGNGGGGIMRIELW